MCGFVGTTRHHLAKPMLEKQEFRGPDGMWFWKNEHLALGHALLDINGEAQIQPFHMSNGDKLVFNGEMYNSPYANDTKFLASGLIKYGYDFLRLNDWHGSIAWYKIKEAKVVLIRDHFGSKPLWYKHEGKTFEFATSLRSFEKKEFIDYYNHFIVSFQWMGEFSPYKLIDKVAAGQIIEYDFNKNRVTKQSLWDGFIVGSRGFETNIFRGMIIDSIVKTARTKQKVGLFLSGGFDSTMVLSIARKLDIDLNVYTINYEKAPGNHWSHNSFYEESELARKTCEEWNIPLKVVELKRDERVHLSRLWLNKTHFPWGDMNRVAPRYLLARAAAEDNCKVILTGDGGDELFSGYNHHNKRFQEGYNEESMKRMREQNPWFPSAAFSHDVKNNGLFIDLLTTCEQNVLAADQTIGMFGMESRPCLLTQNFAKFTLSIASNIKFKQWKDFRAGTTKWLMRHVMRDYLPKHITQRKMKMGWSSPWDNNHPEVQTDWLAQDIEFLKAIIK